MTVSNACSHTDGHQTKGLLLIGGFTKKTHTA